MFNKLKRRYSISLITGEMPIKTIMRYHLKSIRRAIIKTKAKQKNTYVGQGCGETRIQVHSWWEYKKVLPLWKDGKGTVTVLHQVKN